MYAIKQLIYSLVLYTLMFYYIKKRSHEKYSETWLLRTWHKVGELG